MRKIFDREQRLFRHRAALYGSCALAFAAVTLASPTRAEAQDVGGECVGTVDLEFSPGLGLSPQPTTVEGYGDNLVCDFDTGVETAAVEDIEAEGDLSCLFNTEPVGTGRFVWADEEDSEFEFQFVQASEIEDILGLEGILDLLGIDISVPSVPRVFVLLGTVTSGRLEDYTVLITYNDLPLDPNYPIQCLFGQLDFVSGVGTALFILP